MSVHIHTMRNWCARALVLVPAPALLLLAWAVAPGSNNFELADVSGRVTCADHPFSGEIYFMPDHGPFAMGQVNPDGSFQLYVNGHPDLRGAFTGTYRVVVQTRVPDKMGSRVDSKYQDPRTTDLLVPVGPDWNYVHFNLH